MSPEVAAFNVTNGEDGKIVAFWRGYMSEIVGDVDWDKNGTAREGHQEKDGSHHSDEAKEGRGINANFVNNLRFLYTKQWGYPSQSTRGFPWGPFLNILYFRFIKDLVECGFGTRVDYMLKGLTLFFWRRNMNRIMTPAYSTEG
jgi:hypothetical protein